MRAFLVSLVGFVLAASSVHATDVIVSRGGTDMQVKVVKTSWSTVTYMIAGQPQPKPLDQIKKIEFEKKPTVYKQGEKAFQGGHYAKAASYFLKASKLPAKPYFWAKDYGLYFAGQSYYYAGEYDKAIETYKKLLESNSASRWVAEAQLGIIDAAIKKGDVKTAKSEVKKYLSGKSAKKMPYYKSLGELAAAKVLEAAQDYKGASKAYRRLASTTRREFPSIYSRAKLGMAQALILNKEFVKARTTIEEFITKCPATVMPAALNALGDTYYKEAETKTGKEKDALIESARWKYMRVFVLYPYSPEAVRAKYYTAKCFSALATKEKNAKARAKALRAEILKRAPTSEWAQKIKKGK